MDEPDGGLDGRLSADEIRRERRERGGEGDAEARSGSALKEWAELLVRAGVWALAIYLFVFQVSVVQGDSMQPNFHEGDRLLIDKVVYRFAAPRIGDVVVFEAVARDAKSGLLVHRDYIKRIIACPASVVKVYDGSVHVDGVELEEPWGREAFRALDELAPENGAFGPTREYQVPPGRYFVLGDRRYDSEDSRRAKIGFVPEGQIKGKVRCRFWPADRLKWF